MANLYGNMTLRERSTLEEKNKIQQQQRMGLKVDEKSQDSSESSSHKAKKDGRGSKYNSQGILKANGKDLCDCLIEDCPGCFSPCPKCSSNKCGHECRNGRRWVYGSYDIEGTKITITNRFQK